MIDDALITWLCCGWLCWGNDWGSGHWSGVTAFIAALDAPIRTTIAVKDHKAILWYCKEDT